ISGKSDGELQMKSESRVMLHKIALMGVIAGVGAPSAFLAPAPLDAAPAQSQVDAAHCARLKGSRLGGVLIEQAERIAQGAPLSTTFFGPVIAPRDLCRVQAVASPVHGSKIRIQVWMPDGWNGKMLGTGGGGLNGGLGNTDKDHAAGVARGYAGVINDIGHDSSSTTRSWAFH